MNPTTELEEKKVELLRLRESFRNFHPDGLGHGEYVIKTLLAEIRELENQNVPTFRILDVVQSPNPPYAAYTVVCKNNEKNYIHFMMPAGYVVFEIVKDEEQSIEIHNYLTNVYEEQERLANERNTGTDGPTSDTGSEGSSSSRNKAF